MMRTFYWKRKELFDYLFWTSYSHERETLTMLRNECNFALSFLSQIRCDDIIDSTQI